MQKTDMEDWGEIGEQARRARAELMELGRLLSGSVPKTVHHQQFSRADGSLSKLMSELEERMAQEHPEDWEMDTFYGDEPETGERRDEKIQKLLMEIEKSKRDD